MKIKTNEDTYIEVGTLTKDQKMGRTPVGKNSKGEDLYLGGDGIAAPLSIKRNKLIPKSVNGSKVGYWKSGNTWYFNNTKVNPGDTGYDKDGNYNKLDENGNWKHITLNKSKTFKEAFDNAQGNRYFRWHGTTYNTLGKNETINDEKWKSKNKNYDFNSIKKYEGKGFTTKNNNESKLINKVYSEEPANSSNYINNYLDYKNQELAQVRNNLFNNKTKFQQIVSTPLNDSDNYYSDKNGIYYSRNLNDKNGRPQSVAFKVGNKYYGLLSDSGFIDNTFKPQNNNYNYDYYIENPNTDFNYNNPKYTSKVTGKTYKNHNIVNKDNYIYTPNGYIYDLNGKYVGFEDKNSGTWLLTNKFGGKLIPKHK